MASTKNDKFGTLLTNRAKPAPIPDLTKGLAVETTNIRELDLNFVEPDPNQPRKHFDDASLAELADSIKEQGLLQPIVVRHNPAKSGAHYIIVMGERRYRASKLADQTTIKAVVMEDVDDSRAYILALLENLQRDDLTAEEEAQAINQLMARGLSQKEVATTIHKSEAHISRRIHVFEDPTLAQMVRDGVPISQVEDILRVKHPEGRKRVIELVKGGADILQTRDKINAFNKSLDLDDLSVRPSRNPNEGKTDKQAIRDAISALSRVKHNLENAKTIPAEDENTIIELCWNILNILGVE